MSAYYVPIILLEVVINGPGEYLTRGGDRVRVDRASTRNDFECVGYYVSCGTTESWHRSGRTHATSETRNDIVTRA